MNTLNTTRAKTSGYDALSRRTSLGRPNGVTTSYQYDALSHLLGVLHGTIDGDNYSYDAAGNRLSKQNRLTGVTENYGYDALYQLTQVLQGAQATENYTYDPVGNRLSSLGRSPWSYNASNELTSTPATTLTYDNNGNMLAKSNSAGGSAYAWDFENRMSSATVTSTGGTASTVNFRYDPLGRRIQKSSPLGATVYLYDGANMVAEVGTAGAVVVGYAQGLGVDELLAMQRGGTIAYYQADGLGSITSLTDGSGKALSTYVYKAFGSTTANEGVFSPFRYTGREQDPETGLYYYRARYYDPTIGRFLSEDPIGFKGSGTNFYAYVRNSSVNVNDPFGLCPQCDNIPSTGRTVPLSTSSGQWNLQFNSAGTLIGLGIPLNTGNTAINSGSLSIGPNTYAGITLNANGSVSFGFSNAILINNGLSSAYFSSATYSGGQYTQVNGTWGPFGIPVPLPSGWVLNAANGSSSAVNLGDFLSAAINLLSQFNCQDLFGQ
jgi:RHS repeat-associated protein